MNLINACMHAPFCKIFEFPIGVFVSRSFQRNHAILIMQKFHAVTFFFQNTFSKCENWKIEHLKPTVFISTIQNKIGNMRQKFKSGKDCAHGQAILTLMVMIVICTCIDNMEL